MAILVVKNKDSEKEIKLKSKNYSDPRYSMELFELDHLLCCYTTKEKFLNEAKLEGLIDDSYNDVSIKYQVNGYMIDLPPILDNDILRITAKYLYKNYNETNLIPFDHPFYNNFLNDLLAMIKEEDSYQFILNYIKNDNFKSMIINYHNKIDNTNDIKKYLSKYDNFRKCSCIFNEYKKYKEKKNVRILALVLDKENNIYLKLKEDESNKLDDYIINNFNNSEEIRQAYKNQCEEFLDKNKDYIGNMKKKNYRGSIVLLEKKDNTYIKKRVLYKNTFKDVNELLCNYEIVRKLAYIDYLNEKNSKLVVFSPYERKIIRFSKEYEYKKMISKFKKELKDEKKYDDIRNIFKSLSTKQTISEKKQYLEEIKEEIKKQEVIKDSDEYEKEEFLTEEEIDDNFIVDKSQSNIHLVTIKG